jgi:3-oxoacyl-[acyl-carrier-protein] synthase II
MAFRRVVVTGLGALTPIGNDAQAYWSGLMGGMSGAAPITRFDASKFKTQFACEVKNFDIGNYMDRREARRMDPFCHYAFVTCDEAMKDAGFGEGRL